MLVEKTDRLYRNLKDWVTVDELDVEMHFPKEGVVLSRESRSSEKFMHGIKVLMAKNYIDNLSEEARKGMQEKAEQGNWPTVAPLGYRNIVRADGKKIIEPDPDSAPIISRLFEWYATGRFPLRRRPRKQGRPGSSIARAGRRCRRARFTPRYAIGSTQGSSSGMAVCTKGSISRWSPAICGNAFKAFWMAGTPRSIAASSMISPFRV